MTTGCPKPSPDELALLLQRVQRGDDEAFRDLYELSHARVARVVSATVRSPEHTAEVVQELYLYVWQHASSFEEARGSVLAWMTMLARRRAVDRVRHVTRAARRDHRNAVEADLSVPDVADLGVARQEAARLRSAVGELTVRQRDAVVLTFLDGYTHEQAARFLCIPLGTLKTRVRAGITALRGRLELPTA